MMKKPNFPKWVESKRKEAVRFKRSGEDFSDEIESDLRNVGIRIIKIPRYVFRFISEKNQISLNIFS